MISRVVLREADERLRQEQYFLELKKIEEREMEQIRQEREQAQKTGHGGGDFFILEDFINAIENQTRPAIDVYDAVTWSSVVWLSAESERTGNAVRAIDYSAK